MAVGGKKEQKCWWGSEKGAWASLPGPLSGSSKTPIIFVSFESRGDPFLTVPRMEMTASSVYVDGALDNFSELPPAQCGPAWKIKLVSVKSSRNPTGPE